MIMVVVEHIAKSKEDAENVVGIIRQLRNEAIKRNGYITGETVIDNDQPRRVLAISNWNKAENWDTWDKSELRLQITKPMFTLLEQPYSVKTYNFTTARVGRVSSIF
jgi:heme-degrading monooxygenase HmoA